MSNYRTVIDVKCILLIAVGAIVVVLVVVVVVVGMLREEEGEVSRGVRTNRQRF